jgi:cytochrome b561
MLRSDEDPGLRFFDRPIRIFHWLIVVLVAAVFLLAFTIDLAASKAGEQALIQLHRSFGLTVWEVTLVRLAWRPFSRFPNWPADMPPPMRFAAPWNEWALYALLVIQPVLGVPYTNARGDRVNLFFLGRLPAPIGRDRSVSRQLGDVHEAVGLVFLGLVLLPTAATLYHHCWRRDETLRAMLPPRRRR